MEIEMSGSGSGGGGGGFDVDELPCEALFFETQLSSPKAAVIAQLGAGTPLRLATQSVGAVVVVVALHHAEVAGGLAAPQVTRLLACMAQGVQYVATVTEIQGAQVRVRVAPA
jgi:hypothetical protein